MSSAPFTKSYKKSDENGHEEMVQFVFHPSEAKKISIHTVVVGHEVENTPHPLTSIIKR